MSEQPVHRQALPEGTRLQEFELRRFLGAGGFGIAYLGWNAELDIPVAIKEYLPSDCAIRERSLSVAPKSAADEDVFEWGLDRFLEEARVLARFRHRSIVQIYRFFRAHGTGYIAMEYVEGQTLSEWLKGREPLSETEVRGILLPLLDGLEEVHRAGVMHRDIKPGNIMLRDEDGSPVLLDFGAARQTVMAKSRSVTAILTPGYAPVEQYSEKGKQGPWTDIYALGALCHRMLAGEVPEEASNRIFDDPLEPLEETCRGRGSPEFLRAVDWALRVRQEDRPQSLGEWRVALDGGRAPERREERKEREPAPGPIVKPKRKRAGKLAAGLALALLASGGGYFGWMELEERRMAEEAARVAAEEEARRLQAEQKAAEEKKRRLEEERRLALEAEVKRLAEEAARRQAEAEAEKKARLAVEAERKVAEEVARRQAEAEAEKANKVDAFGRTLLHRAIQSGRSAEVHKLLEMGADVAKDYYGYTPLGRAVQAGHAEIVKTLLEAGADINAKDNSRRTLLHNAAQGGHAEIVKTLLEAGADVNAKGNGGETPLHHAGNAEVAEVLLRAGADVNARDNAELTPLHLAGRAEIAKALLEAGADVNAKDDYGDTPLDWVLRSHRPESVVKELQAVLRRYGGRSGK